MEESRQSIQNKKRWAKLGKRAKQNRMKVVGQNRWKGVSKKDRIAHGIKMAAARWPNKENTNATANTTA